MIKNPEEIVQTGKDAIDALAKSGTVFAEGCGEICKHFVTLAHQSVAEHVANTRAMCEAKNLGDWMELHSRRAVEWMTSAVSQMTHVSQMSTKVMNEACEPIKSHFGGGAAQRYAEVNAGQSLRKIA